jgi:hypothetical protein
VCNTSGCYAARVRPIFLAVLVLSSCGSEPPARRTEPPAPTTHAQCTVTLRFEDESPADESGAPRATSIVELPRTRVTLVRICDPGGTETRVIGSEVGVCQFAEPAGALLRARCWWAGQGSEIAVERVLRDLVARRADTSDATGVGPWTDAAELELPVDAQVNVLGPATLPGR